MSGNSRGRIQVRSKGILMRGRPKEEETDTGYFFLGDGEKGSQYLTFKKKEQFAERKYDPRGLSILMDSGEIKTID